MTRNRGGRFDGNDARGRIGLPNGSVPRWNRRHELQRLLVERPGVPVDLARSLASRLPWGDLLVVAANPRVDLGIRREAERILVGRIAGLSAGERVNLARRATAAVLGGFLPATQPAVVRAILDNPHLTEDAAIRLASDPRTPPHALAEIGEHRSWAIRRGVRIALTRNPGTPARTALRAARDLPENDLRALSLDGSVPRLVRLGAARWIEAPARPSPSRSSAT